MKDWKLTQEFLKKHYSYDSRTGRFIIIKKVSQFSHTKVGEVLGLSTNASKYVTIRVNGKKFKAHRLAWLYVYGKFPAGDIDHINHNRSDNRIENLRDVTKLENAKNRTKNKNNKSGHAGVGWSKQYSQWYAEIRVHGKTIKLGHYDRFSDAVNTRKLAEVTYGFHENNGKEVCH